MKKLLALLLALAMLLALCACGEQPTPDLSERLKEAIEKIDAIPEMADDGVNYEEVFEKYQEAYEAYFKLDYDDMGLVTNVGKLWKAQDQCSAAQETVYETYAAGDAALAGADLQGIWYDSSCITTPDQQYVIHEDGSVEVPYAWDEINYAYAYTDDIFGTVYDIPYYGMVYCDYSMGGVRLARTDGYGCLLSETVADTMFVKVELNEENVSEYFTWDTVFSYLDEWGDTVNYSEKDLSGFALIDEKADKGLTYIGNSDAQIEVKLSNGKTMTTNEFGLHVADGGNVTVSGFGRAKGTLYYVYDKYVYSVEADEYGYVTVTLNDGSVYYYYHGNYALG